MKLLIVIATLYLTFYITTTEALTLRHSRSSLKEENEIVERHGLERIPDDNFLVRLIAQGELIRIPNKTKYFEVDPRQVQSEYQYARSPVLDFLNDFSQSFFSNFSKPLKVTSLVRPIRHQQSLVKEKKTIATCVLPEKCSVHTTGFALDISRRGMSWHELTWIRRELFHKFCNEKIIHVIEEFSSNNFHIVVVPTYPILQETRDAQRCRNQQVTKSKPVKKKNPRKRGISF